MLHHHNNLTLNDIDIDITNINPLEKKALFQIILENTSFTMNMKTCLFLNVISTCFTLYELTRIEIETKV